MILDGEQYWNLEPFDYPWAHDMYLQMHANHWTPNQISMGSDLQDFHMLSKAEQHVVENVLSTLTTMDLMAAVNFSKYATGTTEPKITAIEIQQTLFWQAAQETIHSWSYKHLLATLQLDPEDIYTRYLRIPAIAQKIRLSEHYMSESRPFFERYCFFTLIFEGLWFYNGFSPIFSFQRRAPALLKGTGEQLAYIMRDEELHVRFGSTVLKTIEAENNFICDYKTMFDDTLKVEREYIEYILREPILGYNIEDHMEHCRYLANRRCRYMGWAEPYPGALSALPWLDAITGGLKKEKNFFETHVMEYQSGQALLWD